MKRCFIRCLDFVSKVQNKYPKFNAFKRSSELVRSTRSYSVRMKHHINIVKSENDKRNYRWINLDNGLQAILISDLLEGEEEADEAPWDDEDEEQDGNEEEEEEGHHEEEMEEEDECGKEEGGEKKSAAALCISNGSFSDPPNIPGLAHFLEH
ncbi:uncharacterized protein LOC134262598, partial [Saccostrea cucullata]|uniref:uncharacterized protein LOC134262598 n=1 Tax=Saccostrea cuccullata TaxID=36930 RepID=UPI002ED053B1